MTQEEVTTAMKNDCYLDSVDNNTLVTFNIVSYRNFQIDDVIFKFNEDYRYGLTSISFHKEVNTLKEAINLRDDWMKHFSSYYQKFMRETENQIVEIEESDFDETGKYKF